ncbi:hypothetical protein [Dictyobacter aurantiacus]|uniref:hypothetical protein n=1 Tax=Dictyobacter aurantiacus TaxID=1936993 RepID=UPI00135A4BF9|nr:hypothetical protein [Dictyobacter aurantiacus]
METTMPRSVLRHRMISTDRTLPRVALHASKAHPEPTHMASPMHNSPRSCGARSTP